MVSLLPGRSALPSTMIRMRGRIRDCRNGAITSYGVGQSIDCGKRRPRRYQGMKTLYLLRHAKSSWKDRGLDDLDRPLNKRGRETAKTMAAYLRRAKITPDRSCARRRSARSRRWNPLP